MNKLELAKIAIRWITVAGTSTIVHDIIANNVEEPETLFKKAKLLAGTFAIGGMVAATVGDYTDDKIDELVDQVREFRAKNTEDAVE